MRRILPLVLLALASSATFADEPAITLPPGTTDLAPGPGADLARSQCLICHSSDFIATQPPQADRTFWGAELDKMHKLGALFTAEQRPLLLDYVVRTYGNEKGSAPAPLAAAAIGSAAPAVVSDPRQLAQASWPKPVAASAAARSTRRWSDRRSTTWPRAMPATPMPR